MKKGLIVGLLVSVLMLSFASIAFADLPTKLEKIPELKNLGDIVGIIDKAANVVFTALLILASVFIIIAAFQFLTGGGNAEQLGEARGKIIWAVVAIVVALLAKALPTIVSRFLGTVEG